MINKEELLKNLACFGCEYRDECEDEWEDTEHCSEKLKDACEFCDDNGLLI